MVEMEVEVPESMWEQLEWLARIRGDSVSEIVAGAMRDFVERGEQDARE